MVNKPFSYKAKLIPLKIENASRESFAEKLKEIPYLLYEVEVCKDGNVIAVNKPGGKRSYGRLSKDDLKVFICNPTKETLWLISHNEIKVDLIDKFNINPEKTKQIVKGLYRVCQGKDPDLVLQDIDSEQNLPGLSPEAIYKCYKWIWGQEDCNYKNGEGRWYSMNPILEHFGINKTEL